jgi:hypothetical protein
MNRAYLAAVLLVIAITGSRVRADVQPRTGLHPLRDYRSNGGATPTPWTAKCWSDFVNDWWGAADWPDRHAT